MTETLPEIYRDDWLVAVHKPAGLLVHRSDIDRHETRFAVQMVREQTGRKVYPAHRLDKGTSGILLFAFDPVTAAALGAMFERGEVGKRYLAVVRGWPEISGTIDHPLSRLADDYAGMTGKETAQPAVTHYRRLATCELPVRIDRYPSSRYALVELEPVTGRRHQLRRHLKHISHPIIGDATYGKGVHNRYFQAALETHRLLLANVCLFVAHPVSGERLLLDAEPSEDFCRPLQRLGMLDALLDNRKLM